MPGPLGYVDRTTMTIGLGGTFALTGALRADRGVGSLHSSRLPRDSVESLTWRGALESRSRRVDRSPPRRVPEQRCTRSPVSAFSAGSPAQ